MSAKPEYPLTIKRVPGALTGAPQWRVFNRHGEAVTVGFATKSAAAKALLAITKGETVHA